MYYPVLSVIVKKFPDLGQRGALSKAHRHPGGASLPNHCLLAILMNVSSWLQLKESQTQLPHWVNQTGFTNLRDPEGNEQSQQQQVDQQHSF